MSVMQYGALCVLGTSGQKVPKICSFIGKSVVVMPAKFYNDN